MDTARHDGEADSDDGGVTVLVEFSLTDSERAQALARDVADGIAQTFAHRKGFLSATLLVSSDGRRMVNVARWTSEQDWLAATRSPAQQNPPAEGAGQEQDWLSRRGIDEPVARILNGGGAALDRIASFRPVRTVTATWS